MPRIRSVLALLCLALPLLAQGPPRRTAYESNCGSEIAWMSDLDAAIERAAAEKKPIFWFIPTAYRTPLDRKQEVYWYMMGGPFSEPRVVSWVNENFVALKLGFSPLLRRSDELATLPRQRAAALADRYQLNALQFVEPGFIILDQTGEPVHVVDRLLSFQIDWFGERLDRALAPHAERIGKLPFPAAADDGLLDIRRKMARGAEAGAFKSLGLLRKGMPKELVPEMLWLEGLARWFMRDRDDATKVWEKLCASHPKTIWAARARLELDGWGPFTRGFATTVAPEAKYAASTDLRTTRLVGVQDDLQMRIRRGLHFLLRMQNEDGSWTDSRYDFGGTDSLPNVHVAVTALAALGLLDWREVEPQAVSSALERAIPYLVDDRNLASKDVDEIIWAQVYRLDFLLRAMETMPEQKRKLVSHAQRIVKAIEADQLKSGAFRHEYPNPFATASAVLVLKKASEAGLKVTDARLDAATKALLGARDDESATFGYGMRAGSTVEFAAGRMPLCELALFLAGASDEAKLERAVRTSWEQHHHYEQVRNYDDHARPHRIGGFFYWYDIHGRTEATLRLPADKAAALAEDTRALVEGLQEADGSWIDSHELGKVYGTGMALTVLGLLKEKAER